LFVAGLLVPLGILAVGRRRSRDRVGPFLPVAAPGNGPEPETADRRAKQRRRGEPVRVLARLGGEEVSGWVVDRSSGGLGLQLPRAVAADAVLQVRAVVAPEGTPWVGVRVRHCRQLKLTHWAAGGAFVQTPPWAILLLFG
jgi:hypothetical protein